MADHKSDTAPVRPRRINHIVLNVRDIEESHRFWTEIVGMKQVATLRPRPGVTLPKMRFYSADHDGKDTHHDIALVESPNVPSPEEWKLSGGSVAVNHIAMQLPDRGSWLKQHVVTHSVYVNDPNGYGVEFLYELPREMWENDIQGAIDYLENLPTDGPEALADRTDSPSFGQAQPALEPAK